MQSQPLRGVGLTVGPSLRAVGSAPEAGPEASSHFLPHIFLPRCRAQCLRASGLPHGFKAYRNWPVCIPGRFESMGVSSGGRA